MKAFTIIAGVLAIGAGGACAWMYFEFLELRSQLQPIKQELADLKTEATTTRKTLNDFQEKHAKGEPPKGVDDEARWARDVASRYFAVAGRDFFASEALQLTNSVFRERIEKGSSFTYYTYKTWEIKGVKLLPSNEEAILTGSVDAIGRGAVHPKQRGSFFDDKFKGQASFTMRVVRKAEAKRWEVESILFEPPWGLRN